MRKGSEISPRGACLVFISQAHGGPATRDAHITAPLPQPGLPLCKGSLPFPEISRHCQARLPAAGSHPELLCVAQT